ncbi:MAG: hypothetical protein ABSE73_25660 [Planctomycetota bacterium]
MPELELPVSTFFKTAEPSAAAVPHLITYFDPELLQAIVRINGAKLGAWPLYAPFNEEDKYDTSRENVPLSAWALPLNQQELLTLGMSVNSLIFDGNTLIVGHATAEKALEECDAARGEQGYEDLPDFPGLLAKISWALVPVGAERDYALFVASREKMDYFDLLARWCHERGRAYWMFAEAGMGTDGDREPVPRQVGMNVSRGLAGNGNLSAPGLVLRCHPAPVEGRRNAAIQYGHEFLAKVAHFGIGPSEALTHLAEAIKQARH